MHSPAPLLVLSLLSLAHAGPAENAVIAAMQLGEARSYSWTTTVSDDGATYTIEGRAVERGLTWVRLPIIGSIAQRLPHHGEGSVEAYFFSGDVAVVRTNDGWRTWLELGEDEGESPDPFRLTRGRGLGGRMGTLGAPITASTGARRLRRVVANDAASVLQRQATFGVTHPHEELGLIVSSFVDLNVSGPLVTGTLSEVGARLLFVRDCADSVSPRVAAGTFRLWVERGQVARYQVQLEGLIAGDHGELLLRRTFTTVLRDVNTTKVQVPDEARSRAGR